MINPIWYKKDIRDKAVDEIMKKSITNSLLTDTALQIIYEYIIFIEDKLEKKEII